MLTRRCSVFTTDAQQLKALRQRSKSYMVQSMDSHTDLHGFGRLERPRTMLLTGERRKDFTDNQRRIIKALGLDNMPDEIHLINGYVHVVRDIKDVIFFGYDDPEIVAVKISNEMDQTMVIPWDMVAELRWNR